MGIKQLLPRRSSVTSFLIATLSSFLLVSCAMTPVEKAENYITQDQWMKAVLEYREALAKNPTDVEYKSRLKQTELKAADHYYQRGITLLEQDDLDGAILQFQQGLAAMHDHAKLLQVMNQTLMRKEAVNLVGEAKHEMEAGKLEDAQRRLKRALELYPDTKSAREMLANIQKETGAEPGKSDRLEITSRSPISLTFRQTDIRTAFEFVAKSFGIDVIFDDAIKSTPVTIFAKDITFEQALNLILVTTKTFYKKVGPSTILIAPDTKEKRGQYEDQYVRTFQLSSIKAKDMAKVLKGLVTVKKMVVNDSLNTLLVRDTADTLKLVSEIVQANDRRSAELILEVEILEVNRTKAERLGLDFGSYQVGASIPSGTSVPYTSDVGGAFRSNAMLTLPSVIFNFYKQDVDAKTLANPRIRVLSGKSAKIHIGDRVPLRASTIQDATGQIRTTYDYKDIGIKLTTEPIIHLDNSVTVKVGLEVSSLGANLGTQSEPAYSIGTRNAETYMTLRDGETAILGGLIRDEDRKTIVKVPLLGDIPIVGQLFTSHDSSNQRTDVLLTITPRVVRGWDLPRRDRMFVSGTASRYSSEPLFANFDKPVMPAKKTISDIKGKNNFSLRSKMPATSVSAAAAKTQAETSLEDAKPGSEPDADINVPLLAFSKPIYESPAGQEFEIDVSAKNIKGISKIPVEILYNPQMLKYVRNEPGVMEAKDAKVTADENRGIITVNLSYSPDKPVGANGVLTKLILRGEHAGISYLVYKVPTLTNDAGKSVNVQVRASRVIIK